MKLAFLFFLILSLSFVGAAQHSFDLNSFFVQTSIQKGDVATAQVQFINLANDQMFYFTKSGDFFDFTSSSLFVGAGESANVPLIFGENLSEGIYVGNFILSSEDGDSTLVPVILGVKSKKVLFDVGTSVSPQFSVVVPGDRVVADLQLYNLGSLSDEVNLSYGVIDMNGTRFSLDSQIVSVANKISFTKEIYLPKTIPEGDYVFYASVRNGDSFGLSSFLFTISKHKSSSKDYSFFIVLGIVFILLVLFLFFSWRWNNRLASSAKYWDNKVSELKKMKVGSGARKLRKLEYELGLLEDAHSKGYVKKESYEQTKTKLLSLIRQLKKRL